MAILDHWPLFGLCVRTPRMEVRPPDDELGLEAAELAMRGVHDPATMPFGFPWTDAPAEEIGRNSLQHYWLMRAQLRPQEWHLTLVAIVDGEVVGAGGLVAEQFARRRVFETGSWMSRARQGEGLGFEFRQACLHLGFAGLGADVATTAAWHDNGPSLGVTGKLPYEANGEDVLLRRVVADRMLKFRMRAGGVGGGAPRRHHHRGPGALPPAARRRLSRATSSAEGTAEARRVAGYLGVVGVLRAGPEEPPQPVALGAGDDVDVQVGHRLADPVVERHPRRRRRRARPRRRRTTAGRPEHGDGSAPARSSRVGAVARGATSTWPLKTGRMSRNADHVGLVEHQVAGVYPAAIAQKRQTAMARAQPRHHPPPAAAGRFNAERMLLDAQPPPPSRPVPASLQALHGA